jgi:hypothetical protein
MVQRTDQIELTALLISCVFLFSMLGLAIYSRSRNEPKIIVFTAGESRQFQLSWINCTRVTFSDGGGFSFQGFYTFDSGKTYSVTYLDRNEGFRIYPEIIKIEIVS